MEGKTDITSNASGFLAAERKDETAHPHFVDDKVETRTTISQMFAPAKSSPKFLVPHASFPDRELYGESKHSHEHEHEREHEREHLQPKPNPAGDHHGGHKAKPIESDSDSDSNPASTMHVKHKGRESESDSTASETESESDTESTKTVDDDDDTTDDSHHHHHHHGGSDDRIRHLAKKMAKRMVKKYRDADDSNDDEEPHDPQERLLLKKRKYLGEIKEMKSQLGSVVELDPDRCPPPTSMADSRRIIKQEWEFWKRALSVEEQKGTMKETIKFSMSLLQNLLDKYDFFGMSLYGIIPQLSELLDKKDRLVEQICRKFTESVNLEPELLLFGAIAILVGTHITTGHGHELKKIDEAKKARAREKKTVVQEKPMSSEDIAKL